MEEQYTTSGDRTRKTELQNDGSRKEKTTEERARGTNRGDKIPSHNDQIESGMLSGYRRLATGGRGRGLSGRRRLRIDGSGFIRRLESAALGGKILLHSLVDAADITLVVRLMSEDVRELAPLTLVTNLGLDTCGVGGGTEAAPTDTHDLAGQQHVLLILPGIGIPKVLYLLDSVVKLHEFVSLHRIIVEAKVRYHLSGEATALSRKRRLLFLHLCPLRLRLYLHPGSRGCTFPQGGDGRRMKCGGSGRTGKSRGSDETSWTWLHQHGRSTRRNSGGRRCLETQSSNEPSNVLNDHDFREIISFGEVDIWRQREFFRGILHRFLPLGMVGLRNTGVRMQEDTALSTVRPETHRTKESHECRISDVWDNLSQLFQFGPLDHLCNDGAWFGDCGDIRHARLKDPGSDLPWAPGSESRWRITKLLFIVSEFRRTVAIQLLYPGVWRSRCTASQSIDSKYGIKREGKLNRQCDIKLRCKDAGLSIQRRFDFVARAAPGKTRSDAFIQTHVARYFWHKSPSGSGNEKF